MKRALAALLLIAVSLTACESRNTATIPAPDGTTPARALAPFFSEVNCTTDCNATPSPAADMFPPIDYSYAFGAEAFTINKIQLPPGAVKCETVYTGIDTLYECVDKNNVPVAPPSSIIMRGTIIPMPGHPGCFYAGIVGGSAIAAPLQTIMTLIGLGKIALNPWANLAYYIGAGLYKTYTGC